VNSPKVSVLIPTYRYGRFLSEAIESVLAQTFTDFELIVSDDASADDSAAIIQHYAAKDSRIRAHLHRDNLGMVSNWNWCLREARGEYVKFVFGDDMLCSPHSLGAMVQALEAEPRASLVASARTIIDETSDPIALWDELGDSGYYSGEEVIAQCFARDRNLVGEPSAVLFRRSAAGRGFDPTLRQLVDEELWFHLLEDSGMVYTSEPLCAFRQHGAQQTVVNQATGIAAVENVRIISRYLNQYALSVGFAPGSLALRRKLFRQLYYCRKDSCNSPVARAAAVILRPHLPGMWYPLCWSLHRICKPFENLHRWLAKRLPQRRAVRFSSKIALSEA